MASPVDRLRPLSLTKWPKVQILPPHYPTPTDTVIAIQVIELREQIEQIRRGVNLLMVRIEKIEAALENSAH